MGETHSQYSLLPLLSYPSFPLPLPSLTFLSQFYHQHKPLTCEIDAYGDFLQALGPDATSEVTCMPRHNEFPITLVLPKVWCTSVKHSSTDLKCVGGFGMVNTIMIGGSNIQGVAL